MPRSIHTLGQALDSGQRLVAICDNVECRHRRVIDLGRIIEHVGSRHSLIPLRGQVHFSERLRCPACHGRGAFIWVQEMPGPTPALAGLSYSINRWSGPTGHALVEIVARASSEAVAHVAFNAAETHYGGEHLTLQQRAYIIRDNRLRLIKGGKL